MALKPGSGEKYVSAPWRAELNLPIKTAISTIVGEYE
jgi:hypothetical protein